MPLYLLGRRASGSSPSNEFAATLNDLVETLPRLQLQLQGQPGYSTLSLLCAFLPIVSHLSSHRTDTTKAGSSLVGLILSCYSLQASWLSHQRTPRRHAATSSQQPAANNSRPHLHGSAQRVRRCPRASPPASASRLSCWPRQHTARSFNPAQLQHPTPSAALTRLIHGVTRRGSDRTSTRIRLSAGDASSASIAGLNASISVKPFGSRLFQQRAVTSSAFQSLDDPASSRCLDPPER